jgi:ribonuclease P/MRP protein subunit POP5
MYLSPATSTAIIRVARDHYRLVWATLTFITRLPKPLDTPCTIQVVRNSGTIRKAEEEAIRRAKDSIVRAKRTLEGDRSLGVDLFKNPHLGKQGERDSEAGEEDGESNPSESDNELE